MASGGADLGARDAFLLKLHEEQLRKKFKHAIEFGVRDRPSRSGLEAFAAAVRAHAADGDTVVLRATFRGNLPVVLFVGRTNNLMVMALESGLFLSC
ncbi:MAG: hypothetical protein H0U10_07195 [Chloroflexia bacterium]|nr:hypothetical protein [Chloroflexia bacterium]